MDYVSKIDEVHSMYCHGKLLMTLFDHDVAVFCNVFVVYEFLGVLRHEIMPENDDLILPK